MHAIQVLLSGCTVSAAADEVGVDRSTIHRWLSEDCEFLAALNGARTDLRESCLARLLALANTAIDGLESALKNGDGRLALAFLNQMGLVRPLRIGSTDANEVKETLEAESDSRRMWRMLSRSLAESQRRIASLALSLMLFSVTAHAMLTHGM